MTALKDSPPPFSGNLGLSLPGRYLLFVSLKKANLNTGHSDL
jgi:hypothetical protein